MLCSICNKNIATIHLTEIIEGKVTELHICNSCAKLKAEELKEQLNISEFLGGLVEKDLVKKEDLALKCDFCGLTYSDFKKKGRLGCENCYKVFQQKIFPLLKRIHGATKHIGKFPLKIESKVSVESQIKELRERLERAIFLEEYEEAARLRDEIKRLEDKQKKD